MLQLQKLRIFADQFFTSYTMNITRENIDELNAVVKVDIEKNDYSDKVEKILSDYRKNANIPGFRKGHVPMGMIKKQYGKAVLIDEVNKLLQETIGKYLVDEKLDVLGNPLPRPQDDLDWNSDDYSFEFELGLAPKFEVNLNAKKPITQYKIVADDKMLDDQVVNIQKQYGKLVSKTEVAEADEITGTFFNEEHAIDNTATLTLDKLKGKANVKKFIGAKVDDIITLKTKSLFNETHDAAALLKLSNEDVENLNTEVTFTITEVNTRELAELDQELFDKLYGKDTIKSVTELKDKIKADAEKQFEQQADQKLLNDVTEHLIENTKFDLPATFLQKWIQNTGEKPLTEEEAKEEYEKSEKGMRYQLIESRIMADHKLDVNFEDIKSFSKDMIRTQMAQFGQTNPTDEQLEDISQRVLSNQDEVKRLSEQVTSQKLLNFYKENVNTKQKELSYEKFVKEVYGS